MLDDQIGSSDHARKKFKIVEPADFDISWSKWNYAKRAVGQGWGCLAAFLAPNLKWSEITEWKNRLVQWFWFLPFYVIYMVLCQIQLKLFIVTNLRPIYGPRGLCCDKNGQFFEFLLFLFIWRSPELFSSPKHLLSSSPVPHSSSAEKDSSQLGASSVLMVCRCNSGRDRCLR